MTDANSRRLREALAEFDAKNYAAAFKLLQPLAAAGSPKAQCCLACLYQLGLGVDADGRKAVELYEKVARQNIVQECLSGLAYNNLAAIYFAGAPGVDMDHDLAQQYRQRAKDLGFPM